jgi:hypothetical protein
MQYLVVSMKIQSKIVPTWMPWGSHTWRSAAWSQNFHNNRTVENVMGKSICFDKALQPVGGRRYFSIALEYYVARCFYRTPPGLEWHLK